jgi:hypothetical protein
MSGLEAHFSRKTVQEDERRELLANFKTSATEILSDINRLDLKDDTEVKRVNKNLYNFFKLATTVDNIKLENNEMVSFVETVRNVNNKIGTLGAATVLREQPTRSIPVSEAPAPRFLPPLRMEAEVPHASIRGETTNFVYVSFPDTIVVDLNGKKFLELFSRAKEFATQDGQLKPEKVLGSVFLAVVEAFRITDNDKVWDIMGDYIDSRLGPKLLNVPLERYLEEGVGVCRHQAAAVTALLLKFEQEGTLKGSVHLVQHGSGISWGHAWTEYTRTDGTIYIIDTALEWSGTLKDGKLVGKRLEVNMENAKLVESEPPWKYRE